MKKLSILALALLLLSCQEEGVLTQTPNSTTLNPNATLRYFGDFYPTAGIQVEGGVRIYQTPGGFQLELNGFSISSGPDLKVYLSQADTPSNFVNLGNLTGQTVYSIPNAVNLSNYSHVLIHCQQYNHLFAIAPLQEN